MNRRSLDRALGAMLLALTVILSIMMIRSPGTIDVPLFLDWTEVVYQDGLIAGYTKVIDHYRADYPPLSYAILYCARAFGEAMGMPPLLSFKVSLLAFQLISAVLILMLSGSCWIASAFNASLLLSGRAWLHGRLRCAQSDRGLLGVSVAAECVWRGILPDCVSNQVAAAHCSAVCRNTSAGDFQSSIVTFLVAIFNVNLFVFYGVTGTQLQNRVVSVDMSLVLAVLFVLAWPCIVLYGWNAAQPRTVQTSLK